MRWLPWLRGPCLPWLRGPCLPWLRCPCLRRLRGPCLRGRLRGWLRSRQLLLILGILPLLLDLTTCTERYAPWLSLLRHKLLMVRS